MESVYIAACWLLDFRVGSHNVVPSWLNPAFPHMAFLPSKESGHAVILWIDRRLTRIRPRSECKFAISGPADSCPLRANQNAQKRDQTLRDMYGGGSLLELPEMPVLVVFVELGFAQVRKRVRRVLG